MDVGRPPRLGARRLVGLLLLPDDPDGARGARLPGRVGHRPRPLPLGLQPGPGGADVAPSRRPIRPRRPLPSPLLLPAEPDPPPDPQGPAYLPARPGAVVAVLNLLRPPGDLLRQHPPPQLR